MAISDYISLPERPPEDVISALRDLLAAPEYKNVEKAMQKSMALLGGAFVTPFLLCSLFAPKAPYLARGIGSLALGTGAAMQVGIWSHAAQVQAVKEMELRDSPTIRTLAGRLPPKAPLYGVVQEGIAEAQKEREQHPGS